MARSDPKSASAGPRAVARRARESLYREHILAAAERVFAERGFEAARVQDISRGAGLSMGSIYALFAGKEQIHASIVERRGAEIRALVSEIVSREAGPVATLEALASSYVDYFHAHPDFLRMQIQAGTAWTLAARRPGQRGALAREIHRLQREVFARGVAAGVFLDEDPTYLSFLFTGMDEIHLAQWVAGGMREPAARSRARFLRIVRKTFLR